METQEQLLQLQQIHMESETHAVLEDSNLENRPTEVKEEELKVLCFAAKWMNIPLFDQVNKSFSLDFNIYVTWTDKKMIGQAHGELTPERVQASG
jgi:hypothetical protein